MVEGVDGINLAQDRKQCRAFVNTVMNGQVPLISGDCLGLIQRLTLSYERLQTLDMVGWWFGLLVGLLKKKRMCYGE